MTGDGDDEPDTSDIPEVGEEWFKRAALRRLAAVALRDYDSAARGLTRGRSRVV